MEMLSDTDWREHWLGLATDEEIARWRASALYEMEHDYTHAAMSDIYPMSRGILRILARYDALAFWQEEGQTARKWLGRLMERGCVPEEWRRYVSQFADAPDDADADAAGRGADGEAT